MSKTTPRIEFSMATGCSADAISAFSSSGSGLSPYKISHVSPGGKMQGSRLQTKKFYLFKVSVDWIRR